MDSYTLDGTPLPGNGATGARAPSQAGQTGSAPSPIATVAAWLARASRHLGARLFTAADQEAIWRGWQTIRLQGGLARCYRDIRFCQVDID